MSQSVFDWDWKIFCVNQFHFVILIRDLAHVTIVSNILFVELEIVAFTHYDDSDRSENHNIHIIIQLKNDSDTKSFHHLILYWHKERFHNWRLEYSENWLSYYLCQLTLLHENSKSYFGKDQRKRITRFPLLPPLRGLLSWTCINLSVSIDKGMITFDLSCILEWHGRKPKKKLIINFDYLTLHCRYDTPITMTRRSKYDDSRNQNQSKEYILWIACEKQSGFVIQMIAECVLVPCWLLLHTYDDMCFYYSAYRN